MTARNRQTRIMAMRSLAAENDAASTQELAERIGVPYPTVAAALVRPRRAGWVAQIDGTWPKQYWITEMGRAWLTSQEGDR